MTSKIVQFSNLDMNKVASFATVAETSSPLQYTRCLKKSEFYQIEHLEILVPVEKKYL